MTDISGNIVTTFQLDGTSVRGRAIKLADALHTAINDRYPPEVAGLLGEAMMLGAIVAQALKFKGRLIVQCHGTNEGAVSLLMADCTSNGAIRGYARWNDDQLKMIKLDNRHPGASTLLGGGTFSMTIDQGPDMDQYQGLAAIEGASLSECAEHYFQQSEQIPTRIRLAAGRAQTPGSDAHWSGGGLMVQRIASDDTRQTSEDDWDTTKALFETISEEELVDPELNVETVLYRLFHEMGVRITDTHNVEAKCACSRDRLLGTLKSFDASAVEDMAEDGQITATCEFCATHYTFNLEELNLS